MGQDEGYFLSDIVTTYRQRGELPSYALAVDWFEQTLRALAAMHAGDRVHGSVGLATIFVDGDHGVRIMDGPTRPVLSSPPGRTGPAWNERIAVSSGAAAPELMAGGPVDARTDLYGVGAAYYELLTNCPPDRSPQPPSSINNTVPPGFDRVLLRLLAVRPDDRYASAMDALVDLAVLRRSPQASGAPAFVGRPVGSAGLGAAAGPSAAAAPEGVPRVAMIAAGAIMGGVGGAAVGSFMHTFVPATSIVGALVGGVVGMFANPSV